MRHLFSTITLSLLFFYSLNAQVITIGASGDYPTLSAAQDFISAGDTLLIESQTFSNGSQFLYDLKGTKDNPIVIIAQNEHEAIFQGGTEAIHLVDCENVEINGLVIQGQSGNGINIDDAGDYSSPSKHITVRNCIFRDMNSNGNSDFLKMSGVDSFLIERCSFFNGGQGGSGIDFVGCHWGTVQDNTFDNPGITGVQCKGGTQFIRIQRNVLKDVSQRALNLGGSTGLQYFRPPLPDEIVEAFEAADIEVFSNVFIGSWAPIAYVGSTRVKVYNNTFYKPQNWVIRILQETTVPGFVPCSYNEFKNNIVYQATDLTEVNIGPNTDAQSFEFSNNLWFNETNANWKPQLPVEDIDQLIIDPEFIDAASENFDIEMDGPAVGKGINLGQPKTDFNENLFGNPPSIGAFEGSDVVSSNDVVEESNAFWVHPNPTSGEFNISSNMENFTLRIYNQWGQIISFKNTDNQINISDQPKGIYFLLIENDGELIETKKLIKY